MIPRPPTNLAPNQKIWHPLSAESNHRLQQRRKFQGILISDGNPGFTITSFEIQRNFTESAITSLITLPIGGSDKIDDSKEGF